MAYDKYYDAAIGKWPDYYWMFRLTEALIVKSSAIHTAGTGINYGGKVTGDDGHTYACIKNHTSTNETKPISGIDWQRYWILAPLSVAANWGVGVSYVSGDSAATIADKKRIRAIDRQLASYIIEKTNNPSMENYLIICKEFQPYIEGEALYVANSRTIAANDLKTIIDNQYRNWAQSKYDTSF